MHFSTHNVPRIISTAVETDGYLVLPRGCEEPLCALLEGVGAACAIQDETCLGRPLHIAFTSTLRPDQQPAVDALLAHRNGVLSATTAFGKTVVAAWLIAQRGVNTLILVHTQALLNQWQAALSQFLQIDEQLPPQPKRRGRQRKRCLIGQIGGGKHTAAGFVDIAMLQSLVHGGEIDPLERHADPVHRPPAPCRARQAGSFAVRLCGSSRPDVGTAVPQAAAQLCGAGVYGAGHS